VKSMVVWIVLESNHFGREANIPVPVVDDFTAEDLSEG